MSSSARQESAELAWEEYNETLRQRSTSIPPKAVSLPKLRLPSQPASSQKSQSFRSRKIKQVTGDDQADALSRSHDGRLEQMISTGIITRRVSADEATDVGETKEAWGSKGNAVPSEVLRELETLREQVQELSAALNSCRTKKKERKYVIKLRDEQITQLESRLKERTKEVKYLQQELADVRSQNLSLTSDLDSVKDKHARELVTLKSKYQNDNKKKEKVRDRDENLTRLTMVEMVEEKKKALAFRDAAAKENLKLVQTITLYKSQLKTTLHENSKLEAQVKSLTKSVQHFKSKHTPLDSCLQPSPPSSPRNPNISSQRRIQFSSVPIVEESPSPSDLASPRSPINPPAPTVSFGSPARSPPTLPLPLSSSSRNVANFSSSQCSSLADAEISSCFSLLSSKLTDRKELEEKISRLQKQVQDLTATNERQRLELSSLETKMSIKQKETQAQTSLMDRQIAIIHSDARRTRRQSRAYQEDVLRLMSQIQEKEEEVRKMKAQLEAGLDKSPTASPSANFLPLPQKSMERPKPVVSTDPSVKKILLRRGAHLKTGEYVIFSVCEESSDQNVFSASAYHPEYALQLPVKVDSRHIAKIAQETDSQKQRVLLERLCHTLGFARVGIEEFSIVSQNLIFKTSRQWLGDYYVVSVYQFGSEMFRVEVYNAQVVSAMDLVFSASKIAPAIPNYKYLSRGTLGSAIVSLVEVVEKASSTQSSSPSNSIREVIFNQSAFDAAVVDASHLVSVDIKIEVSSSDDSPLRLLVFV
eukprot:GILI01014777.1.p1 GENE.GILI01014777.1~~GILI01014777.1.p1  ORF type:complete len:761 (+),score=126.50 GILI01014777.1:78-2360(+)